jgi:hypothetical protein
MLRPTNEHEAHSSVGLGSHRGTTVGPGTTAVNNCVASHGIRVAESYQPASHYWPFQWSETGMFLALAPGPGRVLFLAAQPPPLLTNSTSPLYRSPIGALRAMPRRVVARQGTVPLLTVATAVRRADGLGMRRTVGGAYPRDLHTPSTERRASRDA